MQRRTAERNARKLGLEPAGRVPGPGGSRRRSQEDGAHLLQSAKFDPAWNRKEQALIDQATRNINAITAAQQRAFDSTLANAKAQQAAMRQEYNDFSNVQTRDRNVCRLLGTYLQQRAEYAELSLGRPGWTQLKQVPTQ
jgi:hypothetical protein